MKIDKLFKFEADYSNISQNKWFVTETPEVFDYNEQYINDAVGKKQDVLKSELDKMYIQIGYYSKLLPN